MKVVKIYAWPLQELTWVLGKTHPIFYQLTVFHQTRHRVKRCTMTCSCNLQRYLTERPDNLFPRPQKPASGRRHEPENHGFLQSRQENALLFPAHYASSLWCGTAIKCKARAIVDTPSQPHFQHFTTLWMCFRMRHSDLVLMREESSTALEIFCCWKMCLSPLLPQTFCRNGAFLLLPRPWFGLVVQSLVSWPSFK